MIIKANGKAFDVTELTHEWLVKRAVGGVELKYRIPKDETVSDAEALKRYIEGNGELF
jgi:hypothetical protein